MKRFILLAFVLLCGTQLLAEPVQATRVDGPYTLKIASHHDIIDGKDMAVYYGERTPTRAGIAEFTYEVEQDKHPIGGPPMGLCVQLGTVIDYNKEYTYDLYDSLVGMPVAGGTITAAQAEDIEYLVGNYFDQAISADDTMDHAYTGGDTGRKISPALQVAVWEVLYDGGGSNFDATGEQGDFYVLENDSSYPSTGVAEDAYGLYSNMSTDDEDRVKLYALYNEDTQDF
ncbi:MAG: hypothetical protein ACOCXX_03475, partial [Planctomycetota bacterium]